MLRVKAIRNIICQLSLVIFTNTLLLIKVAYGSENIQLEYSDSFTKINAVSDLADIQASDWRVAHLQSLIQRYGVVKGYSDNTFRGNQTITRYEFAASLSTTLNHINSLILAGNSQRIIPEDLDTLKKLQAEFATELGILRRRTDNLETHSASLEVEPFSTTTQLKGEVLFTAIAISDGDKADNSSDRIDNNFTFSERVRLNFDTSFSGKDRLRTRLQTRNIPEIDDATGTDMAHLAFQGDSSNDVELSLLEYSFPIGEQMMVYLEAIGGDLDDLIIDTLNPYLSGSGDGSISRFAQRNPIYRQGEGTGIGIVYNFSDSVSLSGGYVADDVNDPEIGFGQSSYGAIAQLTWQPSETTGIGLTYVYSYNNLDTSTGSRIANDPFNDQSEAITAHSLGLQSAITLNPRMTVAGWIGFTHATARDLPDHPSAEILNWAITLAFTDLGTQESIAGIAIGQPPKVISNDFQVASEAYEDQDTAWHLEAFYRYQATDNIAITPGLLVIVNPESNSNNDNIYLGVVRTTFSF
ncbi:carbohydrate porin [Fischerella muscicola CCMEE 5323]|uniref:Carbohydrate porin n=1 Tax=Fischerella muscicola CCMEE 5323 TaxID=2019572 RepID=A0A2N6K7J0_FISMU|nr:iron uptake porin [Fischerella muscicola]PLZ93263.1 carbohydrate porin [Fischerella muscicola CCMEE 5323]